MEKKIREMTAEELLRNADECFTDIEKSGHWQELHTAKLMRAQVFMNELDRRDNASVAVRDLRLAERSYLIESWVIILIGLELIIAVVGLWYAIHEGTQQAVILGHMEQSTGATAGALKGQGKILETMNQNTADTVAAMQKLQSQQDDSLSAQKNSLATLRNTLKSIVQMDAALERQLNLAFDVSVLVTTNNKSKHILAINQGKTAVSVWGAKLGNETAGKFDSPKFIVPGTQVEFFADGTFTELELLVPKGLQQNFPLEFYALSADGKPYIIRVVLTGLWEKEEFNLYSTVSSIKQEEWPNGVR